MPDRKKTIDFLMEQLVIDSLLNNLNRDLFYLASRVQYEEYKDRLSGRKIKEERRVGITVEVDYEINWNVILPENWLRLNPTVSQYFENPVKLETVFYKNIIKTQTLSFKEPMAANIVFELFRSNSMWDTVTDTGGAQRLRSTDGKYVMSTISSDSEFEFLGASYRILLLYKD